MIIEELEYLLLKKKIKFYMFWTWKPKILGLTIEFQHQKTCRERKHSARRRQEVRVFLEFDYFVNILEDSRQPILICNCQKVIMIILIKSMEGPNRSYFLGRVLVITARFLVSKVNRLTQKIGFQALKNV